MELEWKGLIFFLEKDIVVIFGILWVDGICFKDGFLLKVDLIVMVVGVRLNI